MGALAPTPEVLNEERLWAVWPPELVALASHAQWSRYPVAGGAMDHVNLHVLYDLGVRAGQLFAALHNIKSDQTTFLGALAEIDIQRFLRGQFISLEGVNEKHIRASAERLAQALQPFGELIHQRVADPDEKLPEAARDAARSAFDDFDSVLKLDASRVNLYFVPQRLAYNTETLLDQAELILPENARQFIPRAAIEDIRQAGRCFALALPTASAFHMLRATETVMIAYIDALGLTQPEKPSWAKYIAALGTVNQPRRFISRLDKLKDYERDEIMHPERSLDMDEAAELFSYVQTVLVALGNAIGITFGYVRGEP